MGTAKDCINVALEAAKNSMSAEEVHELLKRLERLKKEKLADGKLADLDKAVEELATEMTDKARMAAVMEKRNRIINIMARKERFAMYDWFKDDPQEGLKAANVGTQRNREMGRMSVDARQKQLKSQLLGEVVSKLRSEGLLPFVRGDIDREITIEMDLLADNPRSTSKPTGVPEAKAIAKIFHDANNRSRALQNDAGAVIGKVDGYITNQKHAYNMYRMRKAGKQRVMERFLESLDPEKTFKGENPREFVEGIVDAFLSGEHIRLDAGGEATPFTGAFNLAKRMSQDRVLHFKSPEAFHDFFKEFGRGTLMEAVVSGLERASDNIGLMQVWGTNPRLAFDEDVRALAKKHRKNPKVVDKIRSKQREYEFREVSGESRMIGSPRLAWIGSVIRSVQSMSKLGGAVVSAFSDIPIQASNLRYNGDTLFDSYGKLVSTRLAGFNAEEKNQFSDLMGLGMQSWIGSYAGRFDAADGVPGTMTKLTNTFFKLNLLNWWTDSWRMTTGMILSRNLANKADMSFADVGPDLQRVLGLYGIGDAEWNIIRTASRKMGDGSYITPDAIRELDASAFHKYRGKQLTDSQLRRTKAELEQKLHAYFIDQVEYGVIQPDAGTRAIMNQGLERGTAMGEAIRLFMQFKSFPTAVIQKTMGREVYGRGGNMRSLLTPGSSEMQGLAHLITMTTLFGYGAMSAKDALKGRDPRNPKDWKTWQAAFLQGGGAGIYGDFLFGHYSRFGQSPLATMAGPTFGGSAEGILKLWGRMREGDDVAAGALRLGISHVPYANLFYTKLALDYLILYDVQEWLNPGSLRRMERRVQKQNAQSFIMPPSRERFAPITGQ